MAPWQAGWWARKARAGAAFFLAIWGEWFGEGVRSGYFGGAVAVGGGRLCSTLPPRQPTRIAGGAEPEFEGGGLSGALFYLW